MKTHVPILCLVIALAMLAVSCAGPGAPSAPEPPQSSPRLSPTPGLRLPEVFGKIAERCSLMEGRAQTLEKDHKDKGLKPGLAPADYSKATRDYQDAKAALDGWLEKLKFAIRTDGRIDTAGPFLEAWSDQSQTFVREADDFDRKAHGLLPITRLIGPDVLIQLIPSLIEAATTIWQEYQKANDARRAEMIQALEGLKCKPWPN